ncbi:hypothetical protein LCGC14_1638310, partial [marine sediment metagenome]
TPPGDPTSGYNWIYADENANIYTKDEDGNITALSKPIVYINSIDDLTFLTSNTSASDTTQYSSDSGVSFFWADWGNHYVIDLYAIAHSGGTEFPIAGTTPYTIAGVSAYFRSVLEEDDGKTITFEIADTGSTGYAHNLSGDTPFTVAAPLNSGASSYNGNGGNMISGQTVLQSDSGVTHQPMLKSPNEVTGVLNGGFDYDVKVLGDKKTWKAQYNSGVSVVPVEKTIVNANGMVELSGETVYGYRITGPAHGKIFMLGQSVFVGDAENANNCAVCLESEGGVTVTIPGVVTAIMDGWEFTVIHNFTAGSSSATSPFVVYAGGLPIVDISATTPYPGNTNLDPDAVGDSITFIADYDSEVSYWVKSYHIQ